MDPHQLLLPLLIERKRPPARPRPKYDSGAESSDSPVSEYEDLYSSDDMVRKPRVQAVQPPLRDDNHSEEEKMPEPWNAICIVGIRVYSKDSGLELRTVVEGSELLEDGMGEKGQADLDNAQANAGGSRAENINKDKSNDASDRSQAHNTDGEDVYPGMVRHNEDGRLIELDRMGERNSDIYQYIKMDSGDTTRCPSPGQLDKTPN